MNQTRAALLHEALTRLFDCVAGTGEQSKIGLFGGSPNKITWVGLSLVDSGFVAVTNDWFDIVPTEPSFYSADREPGVVFDATFAYLLDTFGTEENFRLQLHLGSEPVLHANTAHDQFTLAPAPEFFSV